jgi:hypothetical protein
MTKNILFISFLVENGIISKLFVVFIGFIDAVVEVVIS